MTTFDPTKPVVSMDGKSARIICTDRATPSNDLCIVALLKNTEFPEGAYEEPRIFNSDGMSNNPTMYADLVNGIAILDVRFYQNTKTGEWRTTVKDTEIRETATWCYMGRQRVVVPGPSSED